MIILIPAYEPDTKLVDLIGAIRQEDDSQAVVIVDDGSGERYAPIFDLTRLLGCTVLHHDTNQGKGVALKTGFAHIAEWWPGQDVVCADCDGQHRLPDIYRVATSLESGTAPIVLGARSFSGNVPLRSRFGNSATRLAFTIATGHRLTDTQTGLRGYRAGLLDWLVTIEGDRFEYELNTLLEARTKRVEIGEVPIETIYLDHNASSHFRPLIDSARIYAPLAKFAISSLSAFFVDFIAFLTLMSFGVGLGISVITARVLSATFNYLTNRRFVFTTDTSASVSAVKYFALVATLLSLNYTLLRILIDSVSLPVIVAKVLTESTLFVISYLAQRRFVFTPGTVPAIDENERTEVAARL